MHWSILICIYLECNDKLCTFAQSDNEMNGIWKVYDSYMTLPPQKKYCVNSVLRCFVYLISFDGI